MAVTAKDLKEYLNLPPDIFTLTGSGSVDYLTINVEPYLNAAKSKARAAGIPAFESNAQYDLFIMALAAMYYDNRGMVFQNPADAANAQRMIDSFVLELRYGDEDA